MSAQNRGSILTALGLGVMCAVGLGTAGAQALEGADLAAALRMGGYVLVLRHADSPMQLPDQASADPANLKLERQLSPAGRDEARALGAAIKRLGIQVGALQSSPAFRARQTVGFVGLGAPLIVAQLDESAQSMAANAGTSRAQWLQNRAAQVPAAGTDDFIVTHMPNLMAAFDGLAAGIAPGEAMVFHPDGHGGRNLVARIKIDEWATLPEH
jgi:phosphohistidine phosphatase SixA